MKRILFLVCLVMLLGSFVSAEYAAAARFANNKDGTVTDTLTGLMWADKDNGYDISWTNAKSFCEGYSGGGKSGWRMPTIGELEALHNSGGYGSAIKKTCFAVWSSDTRSTIEAAVFVFDWGGYRTWGITSPNANAANYRALPVRSDKVGFR